MLRQFLGQRLAASKGGRQNDEGLDDFGALRVGHTDDGCLVDRRMFDQRAFDVDAVARQRR